MNFWSFIIKIVSVLGSGWLGLPLAEQLLLRGMKVKASTTSTERLPEIVAIGAEPYIIDIRGLSDNIDVFLKSELLIVNITSKSIADFNQLLGEIEKSTVKKVLFVSSTSVYKSNNDTVSELQGQESEDSLLFQIEKLFHNCESIETTVLRFGGLIGYGRDPGNFFRSGKRVQNPDSPVNLIHRDDCISIIEKIILHEIWSETFNACADSHPTKREFYTKAALRVGNPVPQFDESVVSIYKRVSSQKLKDSLSYEFETADLMSVLDKKGVL
jgi:nucleoside-diphosphate-sugar epimerase